MRSKGEKQQAHARAKGIANGELVEDDEVGGPQNDDLTNLLSVRDVIMEEVQDARDPSAFRNKHIEDTAAEKGKKVSRQVGGPQNVDLPNLLSVLEKADVILEVLDARDPLAFRNKHIEDIVAEKRKKILFVLSKIGEYSSIVSFVCSYVEPFYLQINVQERLLPPGVRVYEPSNQRYCFVLLQHSYLRNSHRLLLKKARQKYQSTMPSEPSQYFPAYLSGQTRKKMKNSLSLWSDLRT